MCCFQWYVFFLVFVNIQQHSLFFCMSHEWQSESKAGHVARYGLVVRNVDCKCIWLLAQCKGWAYCSPCTVSHELTLMLCEEDNVWYVCMYVRMYVCMFV